jgi:uncharacterized delta-60 repeat protein
MDGFSPNRDTSHCRRAIRSAKRAIKRQRPVLEALERRALLAAGALDISTSPNPNPVITTVSSSSTYPWAVAIQANGSMIVAGEFLPAGSLNAYILGYTPGGSLDSTFGSGGIATLGNVSRFHAITVVPATSPVHANEILAAGDMSEPFAAFGSFLIALYQPNGTLDTSFGSEGLAQTTIGMGRSVVNGVAVQPDGKIVAVGSVAYSGGTEIAIARYNPNGTLDTSFGSGGVVTTLTSPSDPSANDDEANAVAVQTINGQTDIVVIGRSRSFAGYSSSGTAGYRNECVALRYGPTGDLDPTFGNVGVVKTRLPNPYGNSAVSVVIQPDNRIIVGDTATTNGFYQVLVAARYDIDGSLDTTFGDIDPATGLPSGIVTTDLGGDYRTASVGLQSTGKIVVVGGSTANVDPLTVFARYTSAGQLDSSLNDPTGPFGPTGSGSSTPFPAGDVATCGAVEGSNDTVVAAGYYYPGANILMAGRVTSQGLINSTPATTTTTVTASPNPTTAGQPVAFTATVTNASSTTAPTGTVTLMNGSTTLGSGTLDANGQTTITATLTPGSYSITAVYAGNSSSQTSTSPALLLTVNKATPTVTWADPADITFDAALGATQLDATASVSGTFAYSPAAGAILSVGEGQTLSAVFTPSDTVDYNSVTTTATINVQKATPTITWASLADIVYGTPLGNTQLDAAASLVGNTVAGTFTYTPAGGTVLNTGQGQTLSVRFTPTETGDFDGTTENVMISVAPAPLTVTVNDASKVYDQPNPAFSVAYSGFVNGDTASGLGGSLTFSTPATVGSDVGSYDITASGLTASNYTITYVL